MSGMAISQPLAGCVFGETYVSANILVVAGCPDAPATVFVSMDQGPLVLGYFQKIGVKVRCSYNMGPRPSSKSPDNAPQGLQMESHRLQNTVLLLRSLHPESSQAEIRIVQS